MNETQLRKNLRLYGWFKVFNKRVFLPLTAIYIVEVGQVTLGQIGIIATVTALATVSALMPSGYLADRYTRRSVLMTGSLLLAVGVGVLVFQPGFAGALVSGILSGIGFAFISGAGQALIHDSLEQRGETKQYVKVMGRAQSMGLIGNLILIGLVPMTYIIDKRLPFVLGVVAFMALFVISRAFIEPERGDKSDGTRHFKGMSLAVRTFVHRRTILLFIAIGLVFGLYMAPIDYTNLVLLDLGAAPQYLGWAFAGSSLLGAAGGFAIHHLEKLSFRAFMLLDIFICCGFFAAVGITRNLWAAIVAFLINLSFWRLRSILYQHYLFELFSGTRHKAMLVSLVGFGEQLFCVVLPVFFALAIAKGGFYGGYTAIGLSTALLLGVLTWLGFARLARIRPKSPPNSAIVPSGLETNL